MFSDSSKTASLEVVKSSQSFVSKVNAVDGLPSYVSVLSSVDSNLLPISKMDRQSMAILQLENDSIALVLLDDANKDKLFAKIKRLLEDVQLKIDEIYTCSEYVINDIYKNVFNKTEKSVGTSNKVAFDEIIKDAIKSNASNINILAIPGTKARVTFKIYKQVRPYKFFEYSDFLEMANAFYNDFDPANKQPAEFKPNNFSDASCQFEHKEAGTQTKTFMLRWSGCPAYNSGFDITIRLIETSVKTKNLNLLGYDEAALNAFDRLSRFDQGVVLITGAMDSGKTTTGSSFMSLYQKNHHEMKKDIRIEDPNEIIDPLSHPTSVFVTSKEYKNDPWEPYTKNLLRRAPDSVYFGEIRSKDVAKQVVRMAQSGHLTASTLHADDPFQSFLLLRSQYEIDLSILLLPGVLRGIISQKLVPVLCDQCALNFDQAKINIPEYLHAEIKDVYGFSINNIHFENHDKSCPKCHGYGRTGLTPIYEIFLPNKKVTMHILNGDFIQARETWNQTETEDGVTGITFSDRAMDLVKQKKLCAFFAYMKVIQK